MSRLQSNNYAFDDVDIDNDYLGPINKRKNKNYGVILSFLFSISNAFFKLLKNGFFGYLFADIYTKCNEKWTNGAIYGLFKSKRRMGRGRLTLARLYEESYTNKITSGIGKRIRNSHMRFWGLVLFSFGFASVFVSMFKFYIGTNVEHRDIIIAVVVTVLSLPLLVSKRRVGEALLEGRMSRYVIVKLLSLEEGKFEADEEESGGSYSLAFSIPALLGFSTYVIDPMIFVVIALSVVGISVIISFPELSIMATIIFIPLANVFENPTVAISLLLVFAVVGYILKFIRGKRVLRFELIDLFVLALAGFYFVGGVFSYGAEQSLFSALTYTVFMAIYFLIVNSYIRKTWIYRGIKLIVVLTTIVAFVGILEGGVINASWVDLEIFNDIGPRISSFLGNPNMLGVYLVIVFPLALALMAVAPKKSSKVGYFIGVVILLVGTVMTWSRGAWLGLIVSTLLFLLLCDSRNIWIIIAGGASLPIWYMLLPDSIVNRFLSIFTMSDSSVIYRFNTWKGVVNMIFDKLFLGIGVGESAFREVYPIYAVPGTETVAHSHSLFLQIMLEIGVLGALVFALIMIMYMQKCFITVKTRNNKSKAKMMISAGFASIVGALVVGFTDHIWYNYRVFLIFWMVIGLTVALTKINEKERAKEEAAVICNNRSADLEIDI